jgi:hypothetical protein
VQWSPFLFSFCFLLKCVFESHVGYKMHIFTSSTSCWWKSFTCIGCLNLLKKSSSCCVRSILICLNCRVFLFTVMTLFLPFIYRGENSYVQIIRAALVPGLQLCNGVPSSFPFVSYSSVYLNPMLDTKCTFLHHQPHVGGSRSHALVV